MRDVRPTHLLHLAWTDTIRELYEGLQNQGGVVMGLQVVTQFRESGGERAVVSGTCAEYGWDRPVLHEDLTPRSPTSFYGVCKHALRTILEGYAARSGLSLAWGHIFFVYGPHEAPTRLVAHAARTLLQGQEAKFTAGDQIRDYLHVDDVGDALVHLLLGAFAGPVNIASGIGVAVKEVITKVGEFAGRPDLIKLGQVPMSPAEVMHVQADTSRLQRDLGWSPQYDLDRGLQHAVAWWKRELEKSGP